MSELELRDQILRHSLQILRLTAGEQAAVEEILRQLEAELKALLESGDLSRASKKQVRELIAAAEGAINGGYAAASTATDTQALALIVAEKTAYLMSDVMQSEVSRPSLARLESLTKDVLIDGAPSSAWWKKQADDTAFKFAAQVRQGVINGEAQERIVQRIVGKRGEPGIMEVSRRNARALVHSAVLSSANEARLATFRNNSRIIKGVRWLATLDGHTCARCAALDGQAWDLEGKRLPGTTVDFMAPPIHFGDRCVLSGIPKTFRDIGLDIDEPTNPGERASSLGPVAGDTTFASFFARLTPAEQDAQFGKTRAAMFRSGKITIRDLVSGTGRELTLDQLKAL